MEYSILEQDQTTSNNNEYSAMELNLAKESEVTEFFNELAGNIDYSGNP